MAGLNLLAAIVIYWNTAHLGEAVRQRKHAGLTAEPEPLAHISPLEWAPHPAYRRIPVAKAPIADLAYDSAPYRSGPAQGFSTTYRISPWPRRSTFAPADPVGRLSFHV